MDTEEESERPIQMSATTATFMSAESGTEIGSTGKSFTVLFIERTEGQIEQIAFTFDDSLMMVSEILQALRDQGSATAKLLLDTLDESNEEEKTEESNDSSYTGSAEEGSEDETEYDAGHNYTPEPKEEPEDDGESRGRTGTS